MDKQGHKIKMLSINHLADFFIKDKSTLTLDNLYRTRMLIKISLWMVLAIFIMLILQLLGHFSEEATIYLFFILSANLIFIKLTGNETIASLLLVVGGTGIVVYNTFQTGYIYSYNHKWFLAILLLTNFSIPRFTLPVLIFPIGFQFYCYAVTPEVYQGFGTKEDYLFDNLAFFFISYIFLLMLRKLQQIKNSKIADQKFNLLSQKRQLVKSNQLLQARTQQLLTSNRELERFAHIASHDLKTPLNNIISFSILLEKELKEVENKKAHQYFKFIKDGSQKMNTLIKDVLEYSKASSNPATNQKIDLNKLMQEIEHSISAYIHEKNAQIKIAYNLPTITTNRTQIFLLFKNLIENGIKYNTSEKPTVEIKAIVQENQPILQVKDNGIGIPENYHQNIFQMFSRLHTDQTYEGTGLGLALCKKIVGELGGTIELESEIDKGSIFNISLDKKYFESANTNSETLATSQKSNVNSERLPA